MTGKTSKPPRVRPRRVKTVRSNIPPELQDYLWDLLQDRAYGKAAADARRPLLLTLEIGCGLSTEYFVAAGCLHTALEDDAKYRLALPDPCKAVTLVRPLVAPEDAKNPLTDGGQAALARFPDLADALWYDWSPPHTYDVILIDAPHFSIGRLGILRVFLDLVHDGTVVILDNSNRKGEQELIRRIYDLWPCTVEEHQCTYGGDFAVFEHYSFPH